jgi:hypothetical protein
MAALMRGSCTEEEFLRQPRREHVEARLSLARALKLDCEGSDSALEHYESYRDMPLYQRELDPARDAFVDWRAQALHRNS